MHSILKTEKKEKPQTASPRVIRTFQEIKVPTVVNTEEWYEELECGICAHVLGATQAIVPCGHSFCGPCVWQWVRTNKQTTCPHCRVAVSDTTAFIPNIMVDQIIDRKLRALPDSEDKQSMETERSEKIEAWKVIQSTFAPAKPVQKRARGLDEIISSVLELGSAAPNANAQRGTGHVRRASRNVMELGAPLHAQIQSVNPTRPPLPHHDTITDLARMRDERVQDQMAELRRSREYRTRHDSIPLGEPEGSNRVPQTASSSNFDRPSNPSRPHGQPEQQHQSTRTHARTQSIAIYPARSHNLARDGSIRSAAFARRQARGQSFDDPLVVLSDEE